MVLIQSSEVFCYAVKPHGVKMLKNSQAKLLAGGKSLLASDRRTFHLKCSLYLAKLLVSPREDGGVQNPPLALISPPRLLHHPAGEQTQQACCAQGSGEHIPRQGAALEVCSEPPEVLWQSLTVLQKGDLL